MSAEKDELRTSEGPAPAVFTSETGRRYVDADDIARICGIASYTLDRRFRPYEWATPRDFIWDPRGRRLWFAELSLQQLVDALFDGAESDAAIRLREWLAPYLAGVFAQQQFQQGASEADRSHKPVRDGSTPSPATTSDTGTARASSSTAGGRQAETLPREHATPPAARAGNQSWLNTWEAEHE